MGRRGIFGRLTLVLPNLKYLLSVLSSRRDQVPQLKMLSRAKLSQDRRIFALVA
jgi:hypothetical protein